MLPERSGKQQQQQLSQKVSAGQASDQRKRREREGHISPQRSPLGTNQSLPSASDTCSERCRSAQQVPIPQLLGPRLRLRPLLPATRPGPLTCAHKIQKHFLVPTMESLSNLAGGLDQYESSLSRSGVTNPSLSFELGGQQERSEGRDGQREREKTRSRRCSKHRSTHPTASQRFPPPHEHPTHPPSEGGAAAAASTPQHARIRHSAVVSIPTPLGQDTLAAGVRTPRYMRILIHY